MAKTKVSEWSTTPASNTDIDGINIAEGCAPSGINDAIRDMMSQIRSWQSGTYGDAFNGPVNGTIGATTAATGAFTTLSATGAITSTLATGSAPLVIASTTKVANLNVDLLDGADWASPAALGSTTPAAVSATTLSASSTLSVTGAGSIQGLTVGRGAGAISTNTAVGASALPSNTSGSGNVAVGTNSALSNTTGSSNVAVGQQTLNGSSTGSNLVAVGYQALFANTTASNSTAVGHQALTSNTTAGNNVAVGFQAGFSNTTGGLTAIGYGALRSATTAQWNTAVGTQALYATTGYGNTAVGNGAGGSNTSAQYNVFIGHNTGGTFNGTGDTYNTFVGTESGKLTTTGAFNTALGGLALNANTTASYNTVVGYQAGYANVTGATNAYFGATTGSAATGDSNSFFGVGAGAAVTSGAKNTIIGRYNGNQGGLDIRTGSNYIVLSDGDGNPRGYYGWASTWTFSNASALPSTTGWYGVVLDNSVGTIGISRNGSNAMAFFHTSNANGVNGTPVGTISITTSATSYNTSSDYRLKNITGAVTGAEAKDFIMALQPKQGTWKVDGSKFVGFLAHEFQEVSPSSVNGAKDAVDADGKPIMQSMQASSSEVMANLIALVQEQQAIIESLKARLDAANL